MLPDSRTIRIESNTIAVDNDYVVPIDAKSSDIEGLLVVQGLEYAFDRRIKFASVDNRGRYVGDAAEEYESFLDGLPPGLRQESGDLAIQTRSEGARRAWHLRSKHELDIAVVEHETGVEFLLVSVVTPVFVGLATNAIYDLTKWGLNKWLERRQSKVSKAPTFLEIERVRKDAVGSVLGSETIRIRAPVDDQTLRSTVERFMQVAPPER